MPSKVASETAREREVYKYYQPSYISPPPDGLQRAPQSSWDTSLTAFAQLGALRMNSKRCMISLVTRDTKYVIAEATRTLSLRRDDVHEENDELWFGVSTVSKQLGFCAHAVDILAGNCDCDASVRVEEDGEVGHILVPDLLEDLCSRRRTIAKREFPSLRFYVCVPITTKAGYIIGAYSVIDDVSRNGITASELAFLKDMASTVMDHLVATRTKSQHYRAEKLIKGMGVFVEGGSSLREWWLRTRESEHTLYGESSLDKQADREFGVQEEPERLRTRDMGDTDSPLFSATSSSRRPLYSESGSALSTAEDSQPSQFSSAEQFTISTPTDITNTVESPFPVKAAIQSASDDNDAGFRSATANDVADAPQLQEESSYSDLKDIFSRASNLIRESLSISGALFLDASAGSSGGNSSKNETMNMAPSAFTHSNPNVTTDSSDEGTKSRALPADSDRRATSSSTVPSTSNCGILGYSTHTRSSLKMHFPSELHSTVPESFMRRLLKRYPHGKIFNLDEEGNVSSSGDEAAASVLQDTRVIKRDETSPLRKTKRRKLSKEAELRTILTILPGARSVVFFPLWDSHRERWFAGGFLWTTSCTRVFVAEDDLTFFASFSNSIMAEVARLDATVAAKMKVNFLSSISHELRSPLHGVLAGAELLQESTSNLDITQIDLVKMIECAGKTLLDTINHVLDFTKINSKAREKGRRLKKSKGPRERLDTKTTLESENLSTSTPDLGILTEEVVCSVFSGHRHRNTSALGGQQKPDGTNLDKFDGETNESQAVDKSPVMIVLDISLDDYRFPIEAGAFRRIVMNLFGNALKYTVRGMIHVSLSKDESSHVKLSVRDSGQGISSEFLQNHLYTPFAQESALSVGTGLGLSIVRQIVDDLGGEIEFNSEKGCGTEAILSLPMSNVQALGTEEALDGDIASARAKTKGLRACLISFDTTPDIDDTSGILSIEAERIFALKSALTTLLKDWLQLDVTFSANLKSSNSDVLLILESHFNDLKAAGHFEDPNLASSNSPRPSKTLLVISATDSETKEEVTKEYNIVRLQQPFGPHRMAKILSRLPCLNSTSRIPLLEKPNAKKSRTTSSHDSKASVEDKSEPRPDLDFSLPNVLLVEDNEINLKLLTTYMRRLRVPYATAINGLEALHSYQDTSRPFDVILMDISMPIMDGFRSSREIRRFERVNDRVPATIIALTGAASPAARKDAFESGIDRYLTKPVPMKMLKTILDEFQIKKSAKTGVGR